MKLPFAGALAAVALSSVAIPSAAWADGVPTPLSKELMAETWTVIEVNGKPHQSDPASLTLQGGQASGNTQCGGNWTAQYTLNLPRVALSNVQSDAPAPACGAVEKTETAAFLKTLVQVKRMRNTANGLYFFDAKGKRVMVLTAGG